jgi:quinol monooxygenase YgiN
MSVVVVATIYPLPEHRDEVVSLYKAAIARVHAEDEGCELYALHEDEDSLVMVEKWTSSEALRAHGAGAALAEMRPKLAGKLAGDSVVKTYTPLPAGTAEQGAL